MIIKVFRNTKKYGVIKLTFDEKSFELYQRFYWSPEDSRGKLYLRRHIQEAGKQVRKHFHREIMKLSDRKLVCDHINGDSLDNRIDNIRVVTQRQNMLNFKKKNRKGITWNKINKNWRVTIRNLQGKRIEIGSFKDEISAKIAYNKAAIKIRGVYAELIPLMERMEEK